MHIHVKNESRESRVPEENDRLIVDNALFLPCDIKVKI